MNLNDAQDIAIRLMDQHGLLPEWNFKWGRQKIQFGLCSWGNNSIKISRYLTEMNDEEKFRDIVLHEIAHAIAGFDAGHGYHWKSVARSIGCSAERCYSGEAVNRPKDYNYTYTCPLCGTSHGRYRKTKVRSACTKCCNELNGGKFFPEAQFIVTNTKTVWEKI